MIKRMYTFNPDWISPPGDTIADLLEERGWSQAELAQHTGYTIEHINYLVNGDAPITEEVAFRLEQTLGNKASFWLKREALYRDQLKGQVEQTYLIKS